MSQHDHDEKHVRVAFAAHSGGPYTATEPGSTTADVILTAAKGHFGVSNDDQYVYVLAYDGTEVDGAATLDQIAGDEHNVKFTLVKRIHNG